MKSIFFALIAGFFSSAFATLSSFDELRLNEDNRLATHYLLYTGCHQEIHEMILDQREKHEALGELKEFYFKNPEDTCSMVCLERGVQKEHIKHPIPQQTYSNIANNNQEPMGWIIKNCQTIEIGFLSYLQNDANIYWLDYNRDRVPVGVVKPGERNTFWLTSFLGHEFVVVDNQNPDNIFEFTVRYHSINAIGKYESNIMERDVRDAVMTTFESEWERAHDVVRTFTQFGFNKGKLPVDLFASMSAYYYNNRNAATVEEWESKGVFVNWWERDVFFVSMPFQLKRYWQSRLKPLVEAWVGVPLELTDIYGMRRYEDGARLLTHVDRVNTHACSLIVNVAQKDIRAPWKIEIYDFADRLHEIDMEEGDIVFYESARCLHGRMQPLQGAYYVNLFAHYRPVGDPNWYKKPNPEGNIPAVLDIGQCYSNGTKATCDGEYEVPYLSPKLETLRGASDLYDFWERVGNFDYLNKGIASIPPEPSPHNGHSEL